MIEEGFDLDVAYHPSHTPGYYWDMAHGSNQEDGDTVDTYAVNFSDEPVGDIGFFPNDILYPKAARDEFAVQVTATLDVPASKSNEPWTIGLHHDEGARLKIDGAVVIDSGPRIYSSYATVRFAEGLHQLELVSYDQTDESSLELFAARGDFQRHDETNDWQLITGSSFPEAGDALHVTQPGFTVRQRVADPKTFDYLRINFSEKTTGYAGHFKADGGWNYRGNGDAVMKATAMLEVDQSEKGWWTFGVHTPDQARLVIDGSPVIDDSIGNQFFGHVNLSEGMHSLELVSYRHAPESSLELFAATGIQRDWSTTNTWKLLSTSATPVLGELSVKQPGFAVHQRISGNPVRNLADADRVLRQPPHSVDSMDVARHCWPSRTTTWLTITPRTPTVD